MKGSPTKQAEKAYQLYGNEPAALIKFKRNEKGSCHLYVVPSSFYNSEAGIMDAYEISVFCFHFLEAIRLVAILIEVTLF